MHAAAGCWLLAVLALLCSLSALSHSRVYGSSALQPPAAASCCCSADPSSLLLTYYCKQVPIVGIYIQDLCCIYPFFIHSMCQNSKGLLSKYYSILYSPMFCMEFLVGRYFFWVFPACISNTYDLPTGSKYIGAIGTYIPK